MVRFKEYKRREKVYLSVVENKETKAELGTTFIVYPSLLRPNIEKIPVIPRSDFASLLTTRVVNRLQDDIYLVHTYSVSTLPLLGRRTISGEVRCRPTLKIFGECSFILKYWAWVRHSLS